VSASLESNEFNVFQRVQSEGSWTCDAAAKSSMLCLNNDVLNNAIRNLHGSVDEVMMFAATLTAAEFKQMYEIGRP
jgi:hypothetical protein